MIVMSKDKLPESLAKILEGKVNVQCRIAWKSLLTSATGHGDWHGLESEVSLQQEATVMNKKYEGKLEHWLEYQ